MRVLVSLEGPVEGGTRAAIRHVGFDELHLLATDPEADAAQRAVSIAERAGARVQVDEVPERALMAAFARIREALDRTDAETIEAQVNAGPDANLLSAAGMLACLHEGVPIHFVHEEGHTPLPVLTRAPLSELLDADERDQLDRIPDDGIELDRTDEHDQAALNELKDRDLIEREDSRLVLTRLGRSYREHVRGL